MINRGVEPVNSNEEDKAIRLVIEVLQPFLTQQSDVDSSRAQNETLLSNPHNPTISTVMESAASTVFTSDETTSTFVNWMIERSSTPTMRLEDHNNASEVTTVLLTPKHERESCADTPEQIVTPRIDHGQDINQIYFERLIDTLKPHIVEALIREAALRATPASSPISDQNKDPSDDIVIMKRSLDNSLVSTAYQSEVNESVVVGLETPLSSIQVPQDFTPSINEKPVPSSHHESFYHDLQRCSTIQIARGYEHITIYDVSSIANSALKPRRKPFDLDHIASTSKVIARIKANSDNIYDGFKLHLPQEIHEADDDFMIIASVKLEKKNDIDSKKHNIFVYQSNDSTSPTENFATYQKGHLKLTKDMTDFSRITASMTEFVQYLFSVFFGAIQNVSFNTVPPAFTQYAEGCVVQHITKCSKIYCRTGQTSKTVKYYEMVEKWKQRRSRSQSSRTLKSGNAIFNFDPSMTDDERLGLLLFASAIFLKVNTSHDIKDALAFYHEKVHEAYSFCSKHLKRLLQGMKKKFKRLVPVFRTICSETGTWCMKQSNRIVHHVTHKSTNIGFKSNAKKIKT